MITLGFGKVDKDMFRHLVIARLAFPLSKLKTAEYLYRYQGIHLDIDAIYRFLDKLNNQLKNTDRADCICPYAKGFERQFECSLL